MPRTADSIEATKAAVIVPPDSTPEITPKRGKGCKTTREDAIRIARWSWRPGQSGNPGGRKNDVSKLICRAAFENNPELVYRGIVQQLAKGNGFMLAVSSDRAYGKLKETLDIGPTDGLVDLLMQARQRVNGNGHKR